MSRYTADELEHQLNSLRGSLRDYQRMWREEREDFKSEGGGSCKARLQWLRTQISGLQDRILEKERELEGRRETVEVSL